MDVEIPGCDGPRGLRLAMSSRNRYLSRKQRDWPPSCRGAAAGTMPRKRAVRGLAAARPCSRRHRRSDVDYLELRDRSLGRADTGEDAC